MLNTSHSPQLSLIDELRLLGLRQFIRLTRWLGHMEVEVALLRRYYWLPLLGGLLGLLFGFIQSATG